MLALFYASNALLILAILVEALKPFCLKTKSGKNLLLKCPRVSKLLFAAKKRASFRGFIGFMINIQMVSLTSSLLYLGYTKSYFSPTDISGTTVVTFDFMWSIFVTVAWLGYTAAPLIIAGREKWWGLSDSLKKQLKSYPKEHSRIRANPRSRQWRN